MFQDSSSGPSWNVNPSKKNAGQLTDALFIMQGMVWVAVGSQGTQRSQSVCWSMKLPPGHGGEKVWTGTQDGWHQSKSGNSNDWKEAPNKRCQSESWKVKMWKEGGVNFLFLSSHLYCGFSFLHLFSFTPFYTSTLTLPLPVSVSFLTVAFVCPTPVPHSFLLLPLLLWCLQFCSTSHFFTFPLLLWCLPSCASFHIFFSFLSWWHFMLQQPVCLLYLPWELVTYHTIYIIMHLPVAWHSSLTEWSLGMVLMGGLETWLTNYQCMLFNIPEEWRGKCCLLWLG